MNTVGPPFMYLASMIFCPKGLRTITVGYPRMLYISASIRFCSFRAAGCDPSLPVTISSLAASGDRWVVGALGAVVVNAAFPSNGPFGAAGVAASDALG